MQPFLAMILPIGSAGPVDPGYFPPGVGPGHPGGPPQPQPPSGAHPSHPIWRPDLGIWGGPFDPPRIWGGPPLYPDIGGPGPQPPSGAHPSHPIVYPPDVAQPPVDPGYGVDVGTGPVRPTHPIVIPQPPVKPPAQGGVPIHLPAQDPNSGGWVYAWVPGYGWMWIEVANDPTAPPATAKPPNEAVGPAHPIQPTVPQPKK